MLPNINLQDALNSLDLKALSGFRCGDILHYPLLRDSRLSDMSSFQRLKEAAKYLVRILERAFSEQYTVSTAGTGDALFVYSTAYGNRADLFGHFRTVTELVKNKTVVQPMKRPGFSFRNVAAIRILFSWNRALKDVIPDIVLRLAILQDLFLLYSEYSEILKKASPDRIRNFVSFCDVHPTEALLTRYFNSRKTNTVTLQHGVFSSAANSWTFAGSKSSYMLGYGRFTTDEGKQIAAYKGTILPVGIISYIGEAEKREPDRYKTDTIGLILDGEDGIGLHEMNIAFIRILQGYCRTRSKRLLLKFHPASDISQYREYIDDHVTEASFSREITIQQFLEKIDIAIVRNSTCIMESLHNWIPTFIYYEEGQTFNVYQNVRQCKFASPEELDVCLDQINTVQGREQIRQLRSYFCREGCIRENYLEALHTFGIS